MPIGTPTTMGTNVTGVGTTGALNTATNNGPAGSKAFVCVSGIAQSAAAPTLTLSGGPFSSATPTRQVNTTTLTGGVGGVAAIFDIDLAAQLNTGTTLTATSSVSMFGFGLSAFYVTGLGAFDTGVVDGRAKTTASTTFDTQATTAPTTTTADSLVVTCAVIDNLGSITITAPPVELFDFQDTGNAWTHMVAYEIKSATGSARIQGTWAGSGPDISALAAYQGAGGGPVWPPVDTPPAPPLKITTSNRRH